MTGGWTVYTTWKATSILGAHETATAYRSWVDARYAALHLSCLAGVRYVVVQAAGGWVCAEWDAYTNRWREYPQMWRRADVIGAVAGGAR